MKASRCFEMPRPFAERVSTKASSKLLDWTSNPGKYKVNISGKTVDLFKKLSQEKQQRIRTVQDSNSSDPTGPKGTKTPSQPYTQPGQGSHTSFLSKDRWKTWIKLRHQDEGGVVCRRSETRECRGGDLIVDRSEFLSRGYRMPLFTFA
ncbi:hypothetical protein LIA77_00650 [Sarocladium implicatum]|nr:hypothetical protein LIA77_00650 [Sarocladium implicatum]